MTAELTVLTFAALLQALQFCAYSVVANMQVGLKVAVGPRDNAVNLSGKAGRIGRAMDNHFSALTLFTIAVLVLTLGDKTTGFSAICAWTYLISRILYVPAYYFGLSPWRSVIWFVGFLSTVAMLLSAVI